MAIISIIKSSTFDLPSYDFCLPNIARRRSTLYLSLSTDSVSLYLFSLFVHKTIQKYKFGFNAIGLVFFFIPIRLPIRFPWCINIYETECKYLQMTGNCLIFSFDAPKLKWKKYDYLRRWEELQNCKYVGNSGHWEAENIRRLSLSLLVCKFVKCDGCDNVSSSLPFMRTQSTIF